MVLGIWHRLQRKSLDCPKWTGTVLDCTQNCPVQSNLRMKLRESDGYCLNLREHFTIIDTLCEARYNQSVCKMSIPPEIEHLDRTNWAPSPARLSIVAAAVEQQGKSLQEIWGRSLRLTGLCPDPRFNAFRISRRVIGVVQRKKESDADDITLLPNPIHGAHVAPQRCTILRYG